mmetsp:Transcript_11594/g.26553  ORF Transcript_11594/g.26553 Transcript_11594/m.26553 type:complete len:808 (-) Transcript_11594:2810-5233(-)
MKKVTVTAEAAMSRSRRESVETITIKASRSNSIRSESQEVETRSRSSSASSFRQDVPANNQYKSLLGTLDDIDHILTSSQVKSQERRSSMMLRKRSSIQRHAILESYSDSHLDDETPLKFSSMDDSWPSSCVRSATLLGKVEPKTKQPDSTRQNKVAKAYAYAIARSIVEGIFLDCVFEEDRTAPPTAGSQISHIALEDNIEGSVQEYEERIRELATSGNNLKAAEICNEALDKFGNEPFLNQLFSTICARLNVTPPAFSYPFQVYLSTARSVLIGDDLPISYRIVLQEDWDVEPAGFIAMFEADARQDAAYQELIAQRPSQMKQELVDHELKSPSDAITRITVSSKSEDVFLSGRFLTRKGRYILRYYHEHNAMWPSAQSEPFETVVPAVALSCPPHVLCPGDFEVCLSFEPFKRRLQSVTEGDYLLLRSLSTRSAPPPDHKLFLKPWTGYERVRVKLWPSFPGTHSISYVSKLCNEEIIGTTELSSNFQMPEVRVSRSIELKLCILDAMPEHAELLESVGHRFSRICQYFHSSFILTSLREDLANKNCSLGLIQKSLSDIDASLPYLVAVLPDKSSPVPSLASPTYSTEHQVVDEAKEQEAKAKKKMRGGKNATLKESAAQIFKRALASEEAVEEKERIKSAEGSRKPKSLAAILLHGSMKKLPAVSEDKDKDKDKDKNKDQEKGRDSSSQSKEEEGKQQTREPARTTADGPSSTQPEAPTQSSPPAPAPAPAPSAAGLMLPPIDDETVDNGDITQVTKILTLRKSPLLSIMDSQDIRTLAHASVLRKLEPGSTLISVGQISGSM